MLEHLKEEIKRQTHVVRIFPNGQRCLRLVRALAVETHENWLEQELTRVAVSPQEFTHRASWLDAGQLIVRWRCLSSAG
jgi:transposase-like protein